MAIRSRRSDAVMKHPNTVANASLAHKSFTPVRQVTKSFLPTIAKEDSVSERVLKSRPKEVRSAVATATRQQANV